jgi:hypothetical protein
VYVQEHYGHLIAPTQADNVVENGADGDGSGNTGVPEQ